MNLSDTNLYDEVSLLDSSGQMRTGFVIGRSQSYKMCVVAFKEGDIPGDVANTIRGDERWSSFYEWAKKSFINSFNFYINVSEEKECTLFIKEIISPDLQCQICKRPSPHTKPNASSNEEAVYFCSPCNVLHNILQDEADIAGYGS